MRQEGHYIKFLAGLAGRREEFKRRPARSSRKRKRERERTLDCAITGGHMDREDEDFGEGYIAESHPLRPTHLTVPLGGRSNSRAPSISSSVSDLDVPIYTRETTIPLLARKGKEDGIWEAIEST
ncbi:PREDICTED: uncharacterized protein LOC105563723 [Vollenhovia emeryi]|uniref:uncharacterized protein LOC105563723 n=1 Tax=Vollenhovia emeryi TaxID=411798 RepID=UPI0005F3D507|nr:PREDICTED: uncharacterized protein LOC105563723 [Vollenhovia emeryi]